MIAVSISGATALGCVCGAEDKVGMPSLPSCGAFLSHFEIVPGETPIRAAACRTPKPLRRTRLTASLRALGRKGLVEYGMTWSIACFFSRCFQGPDTLRFY